MANTNFKAVVVLLVAALSGCGSSYEAQLGRFMDNTLAFLITSEFAGRAPSQSDAGWGAPICKVDDYADLQVSVQKSAFDTLVRRCKLVYGRSAGGDVYSTAYLPPGYCPTLKDAFEAVLFNVKLSTSNDVTIEYKGSRMQITRSNHVFDAVITAECLRDGSMFVSALLRPKDWD
jgi:hypothetical protein